VQVFCESILQLCVPIADSLSKRVAEFSGPLSTLGARLELEDSPMVKVLSVEYGVSVLLELRDERARQESINARIEEMPFAPSLYYYIQKTKPNGHMSAGAKEIVVLNSPRLPI
jgi:hypothetical protein